jgi:hypothetical protein
MRVRRAGVAPELRSIMCFIADSTPRRARAMRASVAIRRKSPAAISRYAAGNVAIARGSASAWVVNHCTSKTPTVTVLAVC